MKTKKDAIKRSLELFPKVPIHSQHYVTNQIGRKAYLQGWEEAQQDKQTCGFCVEPKQHQKELICEMMRKDEDDGVYDNLSGVINEVSDNSAIKKAFDNIPKEVRDRHAKAAYEEHKQLREAAAKVTAFWRVNPSIVKDWEKDMHEFIEKLEKELK